MADMKNNALSDADIMASAFDQMSSSVTSSFVSMSQGSKTSFKDMARSIISDIQAVIVKALVMRAITGIVGSFAGAPAAAEGAATGAPTNIVPNLSGARATGGSVGAGRAYLVGEKGPEILTMGSSSGYVHNNQDSFGGSGGGGQIINIDARGASRGVEQEIRRVMQDVSQLRRQVPNIAVSAVREQNSRKPDFLR